MSFVVKGHPVILHTYDEMNVPREVERRDAALTVPRDKVFRHRKSNSLSMFANLFRYSLLQKNPGVMWADADIFCRKPLDFASRDYVLGFEKGKGKPDRLNNAIIKAPAESPLLKDLISLFDHPIRAARFNRRPQKCVRHFLVALFSKTHVRNMDRIVTGPPALSYYARKRGLLQHALPIEAFFLHQGPHLFDPEFDHETLLADDVYTGHFLRSQLTAADLEHPKPGSFYDLCVRDVEGALGYDLRS